MDSVRVGRAELTFLWLKELNERLSKQVNGQAIRKRPSTPQRKSIIISR